MANQTFTNDPINDNQSVALQVPPRAPTDNCSNVNTNVPDITEGFEVSFQARNVLKTHENPSLSFLKNELVPAPPNTLANIEDLTQTKDSKSEAKMRRLQANRVYAARYRLRKQAKIHQLKRKIDYLEVEVSTIQSQLIYCASWYNILTEENAKMKARCDAAMKEKAEKDALIRALIQEIHWLKNN